MRVRARFSKLGKIRFTSHRDVARMWERALRRAELPLAYTEGFSPRPKLHFGLALSTGHESLGEYLDVDLRDGELSPDDVDDLADVLSPLLPEGIDVLTTAQTPSIGATSLQEAVTSCTWEISVLDLTPDEVSEGLTRLLDATHLPVVRERKGKQVADDLRPSLLRLTHHLVPAEGGDVTPGTPGVVVSAELGTHPRAVRPAELLGALDPRAREGRVVRIHQWITTGDGPVEPLAASRPLPPTGALVRREPTDDRSDRRGPPGQPTGSRGHPDLGGAHPGDATHPDDAAATPAGTTPGDVRLVTDAGDARERVPTGPR